MTFYEHDISSLVTVAASGKDDCDQRVARSQEPRPAEANRSWAQRQAREATLQLPQRAIANATCITRSGLLRP
ncbi:hypothetical protein MPC4_320019 [Methylocella tundrae]|uniref:Uncharacterized protein n=1 Tax=Methylocella tundrae TaxID=227605 RepID=A0A8B6M8R9_METTU|nr:hypothetical protein MPC1_8600002 [Methylocella tundrae]VTZ51187.1 hypothetical protein MPC4_320019 [Methylocella tundrae]